MTDLEWLQGFLRNGAYVAMVLAAIACAAWNWYTSKVETRIAELQSAAAAAEAEQRLAASEAKVEKLLIINKEISSKLASRADLLSGEAAARFITRLKTLPPNSVWLMRTEDSREASEFSGVLEDALKAAGCHAGTTTLVNVQLSPNPPGRVIVHASVKEHEQNAKMLASALADAGLPDVRTSAVQPPIGASKAPLLIIIKAK